MAHLIAESGQRGLAEEVDRRLHNAYVPEMDDARLVAWASANGLTLEELALIQPTYCQCGDVDQEQPYDPVCGSDGLTYWNSCAANLCGQIAIAHAGECDYPPLCEVCGIGTRLAVVSECGDSPGSEVLVGVCGRTGGEAVVEVHQETAQRWLELQNAECPSDAVYMDAWMGVDEDERNWNCERTASGGTGSGGSASGGTGAAVASGGASGTTPGAAGGGSDAGPVETMTVRRSDSSCSVGSAGRTPAWKSVLGLLAALLMSARRGRLGNARSGGSPGVPD